MSSDDVSQPIQLHLTLGATRPPEKIAQEAFEGKDRHLQRLVGLHPGERAHANDLWEYIHDLRNTDIQTSLLVYLLPFCLQAWREVLLPDVERLWTAWWSIDTVGRAIAAVQYISCLMYPEYENPVFAPWTPDPGGGPPCLWEFEGHLYAHRWLEPNINFLKRILAVQRVSDVLVQAVARLFGQPEYAAAAIVRQDFPLCTETLQARCAELPKLLATIQQASTLLSWSV